MKREGLNRWIASCVLVLVGMAAGAAIQTSNTALGQVRATPPPAAFKSGGQLSVPLLQEIAATLHQIDGRLAHLETAAQKLQVTKPAAQR